MLLFKVVPPDSRMPSLLNPGECYLQFDSWNDWYKYQTSFTLTVIGVDGTPHTPGQVKIAKTGMDTTKAAAEEHGYTATSLPDEFNELGDEYFSIGQSENYYETIRALGDNIRESLLNALRDLAFDTSRIAKFEHLDVYQDSVVRYLDSMTILASLPISRMAESF